MKITISILAFCIFGISQAQQKIELSNSKDFAKIQSSNYQGFIFEAEVSSFQIENVKKNNQSFQRISLPNYLNGEDVGLPELPVYNQLIQIPYGADFEVKILDKKTKIIDLNVYGTSKLNPVQPSLSKSDDPSKVPFKINENVYSKNQFSKNKIGEIEKIGKMRSKTIGNFIFSPFSYNPVSNQLVIVTKVKIQVTFKNVDLNKQKQLDRKFNSPVFNGVFNTLANSKSLNQEKDAITTYPTKYVIVSDPMFQSALQPFIAWKKKKGFNVIEAYTNNPQVGNTTNSIKAYLQGLYNAGTSNDPALSYVLFVGDIDQIPSFDGTADTHFTDLYYCEYDGGGDYIPDVYYGRFSANNVNELQPQIDKTVEYEKYLFPDDSYLDNVVLISGVDASMAPIHGNGQINYGTSTYFNNAHGFTPHVWLYPESETNVEADIISKINEGACFINYTAHGYEEGWADPSISVSEVSNFTNAHKYATMIGNCCLTNTFSLQTCFGESLLRAENKGAIGYIGGSNVTYWDEDFHWGSGNKAIVLNPTYDPLHLGSYDGVFHENGEAEANWFVTQAQMIFAGNMAVTQSNSSFTKYYWEVYHLMGDPSLMTYMTRAEDMTVTHVNQDVISTTNLTVNAESNAYVAVSYNGTLLDAKYTGNSNSVTLSFSAVNTIGIIDIVVTKQNRKPYFGTVNLIAPTNTPYIVLHSNVNDDALGNNNGQVDYAESIKMDVTLKNVGDLTGNNIVATLSTTDTYVSITDNTQNFGNILASQQQEITASFSYQVANNIPDQHVVDFLLTITDGNGGTWTNHIFVTVNAPYIEVLALSIADPTGNNNGRLDAGETAQITITSKNSGHATLSNSNGVLSTTSNELTLNTTNSNIGSMIVGNIMSSTYNISVANNVNYGTIVHLTNTVGTNNYSDAKTFDLVVGLMTEDFETNTMTHFDWTSNSTPWFTTSNSPYEGTYCSQSGVITDNQNSSLIIDLDVVAESEVSFMKKVSSEYGYDYLKFYIDNVEKGSWSGEIDWTPETYLVPVGQHQLKWVYAKDDAVSNGTDAAWVDNILLPAIAGSIDNSSIKLISTNEIDVFPNPIKNQLYIRFNGVNTENSKLTIRDIQGKLVYSNDLNSNESFVKISTENFSNGIYFVDFMNNGQKMVTKIVKE